MAVLIIVIANTSGIVYIAKNWTSRLYRNVPNMLLASLALTDLLTGVLSYPLRLASLFLASGKLIGGLPGCVFIHFSLTFLLTFSQCLVVAMSIERYLSIKKPFLYEKYCRLETCALLLATLLAYAVLMGAVSTLAHDTREMLYLETVNLYCFPDQQQGLGARLFNAWLLSQGFVLLASLLICNVSVMRAIRAMERSAALVCPKSRDEYMKQLDMICGIHREFSRLIIAISCAFFCFLSPIQVSVPGEIPLL